MVACVHGVEDAEDEVARAGSTTEEGVVKAGGQLGVVCARCQGDGCCRGDLPGRVVAEHVERVEVGGQGFRRGGQAVLPHGV